VTIPLTYGYILNKVRRGLGVVLRAYGHGRRNVRVTIPAYRYCPGRMHRNLRATIPFTYRSLINGARRGVRATIPAYRRGSTACIGVLVQQYPSPAFTSSTGCVGVPERSFPDIATPRRDASEHSRYEPLHLSLRLR